MPDTTKIIIIILLFLLVFFSAFFSAAETAYSSVSRVKIEKAIKNKSKTGKLIFKHYKSFGWVLSTILLSNNLVNVLISSLATYLFASMLSSGMATIIATFVATPIIVLFGEIIPKLFAKKYSFQYLTKIVYVMEMLNWIFFPLTFMLRKMALNTRVTNSEEEIKTYLKIASSEGVLEKREATLATNALDLDSKQVKNIFIKIKDIKFIKIDSTIKEAKQIFYKTGHSRIPVKNKNNKFIGIVLLKDIIFKTKDQDKINKFILEVPYISKNTIIPKALEQLRIHRTHMAFVTEKLNSKKIIGLITTEDIIEELIGEIYDEHDKTSEINEIGLHKLRVNGDILIKDLGEKINYKFENSGNKTIKQWITLRINRNFKTGLKYIYKNKIIFKVIENKKKKASIIEIIQK